MAESREKCISLGDSFIWLTTANIDLVAQNVKGGVVAPALVGFETLRALKQACKGRSLTRADVEDIFLITDQWHVRLEKIAVACEEPARN